MSKILLFSGGLDSTLALYNLCSDYPRELIHAVTIVGLGNTDLQQKSEEQARERVEAEFKKRGLRIEYHTIEVNTNFRAFNTQAPTWFNYSMPSIEDGDELHMTYLSSDGKDFFLIKDDLEKSFQAICKLRVIKASLIFEYQNWTKGDIIKQLKKLKLFRLPSYCGQPTKDLKPCGKCMKCISVKRWSKFPNRGIDT